MMSSDLSRLTNTHITTHPHLENYHNTTQAQVFYRLSSRRGQVQLALPKAGETQVEQITLTRAAHSWLSDRLLCGALVSGISYSCAETGKHVCFFKCWFGFILIKTIHTILFL